MRFDKVECWRKTHPLAKAMGLHQKTGDDFGWFEIKRIGAPTLFAMSAPSDSEWQHVSVSTKTRCPSWSVMRWEPQEKGEPAIRFRSKRADFESKEQQDYCTDRTVNFLTRYIELLGFNFMAFERLLRELSEKMEITVLESGKIISHNDVSN